MASPGKLMGEDAFMLPAANTSLAAASVVADVKPAQHILLQALPANAPLTPAQSSQLIDDLRSVDVSVRLGSFRRLGAIAVSLGAQRARDELIPYIGECCDDDDEVLLLIAATMGDLVEQVGGSDFSHVLLLPLEQLAGTEEAAVRNQSVASILKIVKQQSDAHVAEFAMPLLRRLTGAEWFTSRISSAGLYAALYQRVGEVQRKELRALYLNLCRTEETPMVKRAAAQHLGDFCAVIDPKLVDQEFFPVLQKLAKDDQDSVRLLTVQACTAVARVFPKALNVTKMVPLVTSLVLDQSWRVRYMVADKFHELSAALGPSIAQGDSLLDAYVRLLCDPEPEVVTAAAARVGDMARLAGETQTIKKFLSPLPQGKPDDPSVLQRIVNDEDEAKSFTRAALASVILSICTVLQGPNTTRYLLPLIVRMLADRNCDVRLNVLSKFESIPNIGQILPLQTINEDILRSINDDTLGLAKNLKWRVRLQVIQLIPNLAKQLGSDFFDAKLSDMCMAWLGDSVWSIREAATSNLTKLAEGFGVDWAKKNIIPKVVALGAHKSYLYRMTAVFAIKDMAAILGAALTTDKLLPVVVKLASDPVPNVRFNSARVLGQLMTNGSLILPQPLVEHTLANMKADNDADVKYYAGESLSDINKAQ